MPPPWKGLGVKTRLARNGRIEHLSTIGLFLTFRTVGDPAGDLEVSVFLRGLGSLTGILGFQVNPGPTLLNSSYGKKCPKALTMLLLTFFLHCGMYGLFLF